VLEYTLKTQIRSPIRQKPLNTVIVMTKCFAPHRFPGQYSEHILVRRHPARVKRSDRRTTRAPRDSPVTTQARSPCLEQVQRILSSTQTSHAKNMSEMLTSKFIIPGTDAPTLSSPVRVDGSGNLVPRRSA